MVYSFDIFDTLLLRPFLEPQDVWKIMEEDEHEAGFAHARKSADEITYKQASERGGEATIEEAYSLMPKKFQWLLKKEMDMERRVLRANPEMLAIWNDHIKRGERCIIVSDMYLPCEFIESVLRENGFDCWEKIYISRDFNCRKNTGELFKKVILDLQTNPIDILHIGDNEQSDVMIPRSLGIQAKLYKKISERFVEECPFARKIDRRVSGVLALGWHTFKFNNPTSSYWNKVGYLLGGTLGYAYVTWIVKTAKMLGKDRLVFVARDGYVLQKICNKLYPEIKTEYIYAPRITSIAVLGAIGSDPVAISDRNRYIANHFKNVDLSKIKEEYIRYISQFEFDDRCALIDGCSSAFSAQKLVEKGVGHDVFCFYLCAMATIEHAAAFFWTFNHGMPFQMLSEFLFCSPESPIKGVEDNMPVYEADSLFYEKFKMSVSNEITEASVACSKLLCDEKININAEDWMCFADTFMANLTDVDHLNLYNAKNAGDVEQKEFCNVVWTPRTTGEVHIKRVGRFSWIITIYKKYSTIWRLFTCRGIEKHVTDCSYKTEVISI